MAEVKRVLCAIDFSDQARHAMDVAASLARFWEATLTVLHVHPLVTPSLLGPYAGSETAVPVALSDEERAELMAAVTAFAGALQAGATPVEIRVDEAFVVARAIVERAQTDRADLVVLGTHGRSGFERWALGSVAERVLRTSPVPVLTVPPKASDPDASEPFPIHRVLCPVDFGPASMHALEVAATLARRAGAGLTVVHVIDLATDPPDLGGALPEFAEYRTRRFEQGRRELLESIPESVRQACPLTELVLVGKPYREIVQLGHEQQADVIVMGVRGRGAADLLFFGSTANHVVRQASCPVLTVRR